MAPWNPDDPDAVGPEFLAELNRSWTIGSTGGAQNAATQKFRSTVAEADPDVSVYATAVTGLGYLMAEVVEDGDEEPGGIAVAKIQPDTAVRSFNMVNQAGSTVAANLIASIDDTTDPSDLTDYIGPVFLGHQQYIDLQFDAGQITAACAGKRVLGVTIGVRTRPQNPADATDLYWFRVVDAATGAVTYRNLDRLVPSNTEAWWNLGELFTVDGDPSLATPWDEAGLLELATSGLYAIRLGTSGGDGIKISRVRLVIATATEDRLGVAVLNQADWDLSDDAVGDGTGNWSDVKPLLVPDSSGDGWAKADDTTYRMVYRRAITGDIANALNVTLPVLSRHDSGLPAAGTYLDDPLMLEARTVVGPSTAFVPTTIATVARVARAPDGASREPVGVLPVRLLVAGNDSVDGQPYNRLVEALVDADSGPINQYVTTGAGGDYTALRLVIGIDTPNSPTADLTVTVKNAAGSITLGSGSISAAAFRAGPDYAGPGVLLETIVDVEVTLAAATQYRLVIDSATDPVARWRVGVYTSRGGEGPDTVPATDWPDGVATYGGTTDRAFTHPDVSTIDGDDLDAYLSLGIDGPTDLDATAALVTFNQANPGGIDGVPYAVLDWTPSAVGADFARYQLQRRDTVDGTDEWADVAYLTDEDLATFRDTEARLVIQSEWRLRSVGDNGQTSVWSVITALTLDATGCGYTFTTNWQPLDAIGYADTYPGGAPTRDYQFPDADEALVRRFAGRDDFVVFRPGEQRQVRFRRLLLIRAFLGGTGIVGPLAVAALRDLTRSPVPYIAVRDEQGNRWYSAVIVDSATVQQPGDHHRATIEVIPVAATPSPPTITG